MRMVIACVLLSVVAFIDSGVAITCYKCQDMASLTNAVCRDPFNAGGNVTTCTGGSCLNVVATVNAVTVTLRSCVEAKMPKEDCETTGKDTEDIVSCVCTTDRCNGASFQHVTVTSSVALAMCSVVAAIFL